MKKTKLKNYKEFTAIKKDYKKEVLSNQKKFKEYILSLNDEQLKDNYNFRKLTAKQQEKNIKDIKLLIINKNIKENNKRILEFFVKCDKIAQAEPTKEIQISVIWHKNKTWGMNPHAEVRSDKKISFDTASGCGYDKLSSAIAGAFNQDYSILNLAFNKIEEAKRKGLNVRDFVGYGVGIYGFDGGVGYSSFKHIFDNLGATANTWSDCKNSDFMFIKFN